MARVLAPGQSLRLSSACRSHVRVLSGRLWITEPGCLTDFFVGANQVHQILTDGPTLLENDGRENAEIILMADRHPLD